LTAAAASIVAMIRGGKKQSRALEPDPLRVQTVPDLVTRDAFELQRGRAQLSAEI